MTRFLPAFLRAFRPRTLSADGPALIVRIDNLTALTDQLGAYGVVAVLGRIATRIGRDLRLHTPPRFGPCGDLWWRLPAMSDDGALDCAQTMQTLIHDGCGLPDMTVRPTFGAVLVQPGGRGADDALLAHGRAWLDGRGLMDMGRVALLDAPATTAGAPLPSLRDTAAFDPAWVEAAFQPQLDCDTGAVSGFRAVARLRHPTRGMLRPADFLRDLDGRQTRALTQAMLRHALGALPRWDAAGFGVPQVSLIVTQADLSHPDFADAVLWELDRLDLPPARLALEVDGAVATDRDARMVLSRLTICGCTLDLRDFGASSASLDALRSLAPARVLIGPGFTEGCDHDAGAQQMILAVLSLAGHLNLPTLARAVATPAEHGFLAQIGCTHVQGQAIAPAMPLVETLGYLARRQLAHAALPSLARLA